MAAFLATDFPSTRRGEHVDWIRKIYENLRQSTVTIFRGSTLSAGLTFNMPALWLINVEVVLSNLRCSLSRKKLVTAENSHLLLRTVNISIGLLLLRKWNILTGYEHSSKFCSTFPRMSIEIINAICIFELYFYTSHIGNISMVTNFYTESLF